MQTLNKKQLGFLGEERVVNFLVEKKYQILFRNWRTKSGEIDIIALDFSNPKGATLVFVEVKYRSSQKAGVPESAVTIQKQKKICRVADYYRYIHHIGEQIPVRYDVIAVDNREIRWYQNAFFHIFSYK